MSLLISSRPLHPRSLLVPLDRDGIVVAREFVACKPQFKAQVGRRHDDANFKLANVELVALCYACAPFVLQDELVLLDTREIALDIAQLYSTACRAEGSS